MNYRNKQKNIFQAMEKAFKKGKVKTTIVKMLSNYANDNQICLTTVIFIPKYLSEKIQEKTIKLLKDIDLTQYFYQPISFHITIQNIRTIHQPPLFTKNDLERIKKAFSKIIPQYQPIKFEIKGILELPTSLSLKVFSGQEHHDLTMSLRRTLDQIGVLDNKTYFSDNVVLGNITICRYTQKPNEAFQKKVKDLKDIEIGRFTTDEVHLITTNAVCHPNKTVIIKTFNLCGE
ncbi:hypothetical protein ISS86_00620 [Candidatus Microgenomates bacterium]|nr:hypothetical protein [Candidatus Microgenomates bacterium]